MGNGVKMEQARRMDEAIYRTYLSAYTCCAIGQFDAGQLASTLGSGDTRLRIALAFGISSASTSHVVLERAELEAAVTRALVPGEAPSAGASKEVLRGYEAGKLPEDIDAIELDRLLAEARSEGACAERARIVAALNARQGEIDVRCAATYDRTDHEVSKAADDIETGRL